MTEVWNWPISAQIEILCPEDVSLDLATFVPSRNPFLEGIPDDVTWKSSKGGINIASDAQISNWGDVRAEGQVTICSGVKVRSDLASVQMKARTFLGANSELIPPPVKPTDGDPLSTDIPHEPMVILQGVVIGPNAKIGATRIESYALICKGAIIGERCVVSTCCVVAPFTRIAADTVLPPRSFWAGNPGRMVCSCLDPSVATIAERRSQVLCQSIRQLTTQQHRGVAPVLPRMPLRLLTSSTTSNRAPTSPK